MVQFEGPKRVAWISLLPFLNIRSHLVINNLRFSDDGTFDSEKSLPSIVRKRIQLGSVFGIKHRNCTSIVADDQEFPIQVRTSVSEIYTCVRTYVQRIYSSNLRTSLYYVQFKDMTVSFMYILSICLIEKRIHFKKQHFVKVIPRIYNLIGGRRTKILTYRMQTLNISEGVLLFKYIPYTRHKCAFTIVWIHTILWDESEQKTAPNKLD